MTKANSQNPNNQKAEIVAIDDGHSEIKVAFLNNGKLNTFSFPSRVADGASEMTLGDTSAINTLYAISDKETPTLNDSKSYSVIERGQTGWDGVNSARSKDYPTSERNRILVHHALHVVSSKLNKDNIIFAIGTTLPYSDFYIQNNMGGTSSNNNLIERKKSNLKSGVFTFNHNTTPVSLQKPSYSINHQSVLSEGVASFYSLMFNFNPNDNTTTFNKEFASRFEHSHRFMLVDIGGKTTDVVFGRWSGKENELPSTEIKQSKSLDMGMLEVCSDLKTLITQNPETLGANISDPETALLNKTFAYYGQKIDITKQINVCADNFIQKLKKELNYSIGEESELAAIIFVGGGTEIMREAIQKQFDKRLLVISDNARFQNALGIFKVLNLSHT